MKITEVCVKKPVVAWMLMAATIVFGIVAAGRIGISQFPDVDMPNISVSITWEGAAPEVMENDVVEPLEEALIQVEGIRTITSACRQGSASITLEMDLARSIDIAMQDVQSKVSQVQRRLPRDMEPPTISKSNPEDQPIMFVSLSGPYPQRVLSDFARYRLKEKLQTIPGVGELMVGGLERNVRIWLDAARMDERRVTVRDITSALIREHVEVPAGRIETVGRELNVRILGEAIDLETLRSIVVRKSAGALVYLEDIALVEDGFEDVRRLQRVNGSPAQGIGIKKQRGANAVAVAKKVRKALADFGKNLPEGMSVGVNFDSTRFIEESVKEIQLELILSVILTALVCWMFLGSISSTLNVILAIPMSLLGTIAVIYFLGYTFNTFTLLGLALAVGIVVDDAIMVMENIYRHAEGGKGLVQASMEGTKEIAFAALAATLAVVAIFLPVIFITGVIGKFFLQFGITLCLAVLLSYVEAVTLAPARCAQFLQVTREGRNRIGLWVDRMFQKLEKTYARVLGKSLKRSGLILCGALVLFALSLVVFRFLPSEFVPSQDLSLTMLRIQTAVGSSLDETDGLVKKVEDWLEAQPEVTRIFGSIGGGFGGGGINSAMLYVTMVPPGERKRSMDEFTAVIRRELNKIPGIRVVIQDLSQQGFTAQRGFPIEFSLRGPEWNLLVERSQEIMRVLSASGLLIDLDSDYRLGMPELQVIPNRARATDIGISIDDVAVTLNALVGGVRVGKYSSGGRRIDVRMKLLASQRSRPEDIAQLQLRAQDGKLVPLSSVVTYLERPALQTITRRDRERAITFFANVAPGHAQQEVLQAVEKLGTKLPVGYRIVLGGASVAFRESFSSLFFALWMGIVIAYMILAAQFNSYIHPVTVLTILPLSIAGAAFALLIMGQSLNVFSMIGLLLLMGIVKKNSIILVDYANHFKETGSSAREAMEKAGPIRLRPILMTAIATLMAAIPPALGIGPGSEIRMPMAIAVIGGLTLSTLLSLVVVPAFYVVTDGMAQKLKKRKKKR